MILKAQPELRNIFSKQWQWLAKVVSRWYSAHHPTDVPMSCLGDRAAPVQTALSLKEPPRKCQSMPRLFHSSPIMEYRAHGRNVEINPRNRTSLRDAHQPWGAGLRERILSTNDIRITCCIDKGWAPLPETLIPRVWTLWFLQTTVQVILGQVVQTIPEERLILYGYQDRNH